MKKKKHCKFSKRWNQAEFSVLIHLETVLIQNCKVSDILTLAKKVIWTQISDGSMLII